MGPGNALVFTPDDADNLASDLAWAAELVRSGVSLPMPPREPDQEQEEARCHGKAESPDPGKPESRRRAKPGR